MIYSQRPNLTPQPGGVKFSKIGLIAGADQNVGRFPQQIFGKKMSTEPVSGSTIPVDDRDNPSSSGRPRAGATVM
jgi:hypothetical protein